MKLKIHRHKELSSTNDLALQLASQGAQEGQVIVADYQTRGRGRPGNKWVSPPGKNLLFSLLLRPDIPPYRAPLLTQIACQSVAIALNRHYHICSTFKRPNDIMVAGKKICGILVESCSRSDGRLENVVIGIGLNVNSDPEELVPEAISLKAVTGKEHSKDKIMKQILKQIVQGLKGLKQ